MRYNYLHNPTQKYYLDKDTPSKNRAGSEGVLKAWAQSRHRRHTDPAFIDEHIPPTTT